MKHSCYFSGATDTTIQEHELIRNEMQPAYFGFMQYNIQK